MISDEQILEELLNPKKLLIIGKTGSGKTRLINRMLRHIENQSDTIYLFITHDLVNHTNENSYGHLNAERLNIDNLEDYVPFGIILDARLANTVIEFPYDNLPKKHEKYHLLITFIRLFFDACKHCNKRLVMVTDEVSVTVSTIVYAMSNDDKCIITEINLKNVIDEFQNLEPEGVLSIQRFNQLHLN